VSGTQTSAPFGVVGARRRPVCVTRRLFIVEEPPGKGDGSRLENSSVPFAAEGKRSNRSGERARRRRGGSSRGGGRNSRKKGEPTRLWRGDCLAVRHDVATDPAW
jgi:hypothetical protein